MLGQPDLTRDPRFASNVLRVQNREALTAVIVAAFAESTAEAITARLDAAGIANARVRTMAEVWEHPQLRARGRWRDVETPNGQVAMLLPPATPKGSEPRMDPFRRSAPTASASSLNSASTRPASPPCARPRRSEPGFASGAGSSRVSGGPQTTLRIDQGVVDDRARYGSPAQLDRSHPRGSATSSRPVL